VAGGGDGVPGRRLALSNLGGIYSWGEKGGAGAGPTRCMASRQPAEAKDRVLSA